MSASYRLLGRKADLYFGADDHPIKARLKLATSEGVKEAWLARMRRAFRAATVGASRPGSMLATIHNAACARSTRPDGKQGMPCETNN